MKEQYKSITQRRVALYTSAWIEILKRAAKLIKKAVALYTSAWIEINLLLQFASAIKRSHSTRVRGLKLSI